MVKNFYWKIALLHKIENYYNHKISKVHRFILCRTIYFILTCVLNCWCCSKTWEYNSSFPAESDLVSGKQWHHWASSASADVILQTARSMTWQCVHCAGIRLLMFVYIVRTDCLAHH